MPQKEETVEDEVEDEVEAKPTQIELRQQKMRELMDRKPKNTVRRLSFPPRLPQ